MQSLTIHPTRISILLRSLVALAGMTVSGCLVAPQDKDPLQLTEALPQPTEPATAVELPSGTEENQGTSGAEQIAELQETLAEDQEQLQKLEAELENPKSEYSLAETAFRELKEEIDRDTEKRDAARQSGNLIAVQKLEQELASLDRQRQLATDRFDLAIEDRKTLREQVVTLRGKIKKDQQALDELTGESSTDESDGRSAKDGSPTTSEPHDDSDDRRARNSDQDADSDKRPDRGERDSEQDSPEEPRQNSKEDSESSKESAAEEQLEEEDEELTAAKAQAEEMEREAEDAQEETRSLAARLADLQKLVGQEQKELTLAKKKVDLANVTQQALSAELTKRTAEQADASELNELRTGVTDVSQRLILARAEVAEINERLNEHRAELSVLQSEHIVALHEADKKRLEATAADERVEELRNPYTLRNMQQWVLDHGPPLLMIVMGMFVFNFVASFFAVRSVRLVSSGTGRGSRVERENRAKTLVGVFQNATTVGIFITGILMMLEEVGADIKVLMGGVAVIGLAVAFGAQNLIKDYFYGFVMLLENQYMLNDSIRIGDVSGQVERITLRMTVLRDSNGVVHFIPNGTINSVSNETHGWSRAVVEIAVSYDEDLERVIAALKEVAVGLRKDPTISALLLETPSDPAIDSLGESVIQLKTSAKTLPNKHGPVRQEWLRRIRQAFAEMGVTPAYPQRTLRIQPADLNTLRNIPPAKRVAG